MRLNAHGSFCMKQRIGAATTSLFSLISPIVALTLAFIVFGELLTPILEGAGILYVVDAGAPYRENYEAEMEILRWTGRPSMAVINPA